MVKDTKSPLFKLQKARAGLVFDNPFFGSLALRLKLKEDPTCETGWTDGVTLGYNPEWIDGLTLDQTKGFQAHEVMHNALLHHTREGSRNHEKWNKAADYAINPILLDAGFQLPKGHLFNPQYKGIDAEAIYAMIPDSPGGGGSGGRGGLRGPGSGDGKGKGSDPGGCGEVRKAPGKDGGKPTPADIAQQEQEQKIATAQAAQVAKKAGKLPGGLERWVDEILNPKLDWREILRRFVDQAAKNDYSWMPPNRRYVHMGLYLPSLKSNELGKILVAVDTSGSISQDNLKEFASELSGIIEEFDDVEATVIYCDTRVAGVETFKKEDLPIVLHAAGGGGTDFRPPFEYAEENGIDPKCMIYLTDLECSRYPDEPHYPTLWVYDGGGDPSRTPPFGEVLSLN